jgi:hypothetical protein
VTSIIHVNQVQMLYLAELKTPEYGPGDESLEVELFTEEQIPWDELAFQTIHNALRLYFEDRRNNRFPLRHIELDTPRGKYMAC